MAIKMRTGLESEFDPSKMITGEWAVSTDAKYVRMCFAPGIVLRMATYENFEEDVEKIQSILKECREIESAVKSIQSIVTSKAALSVEYANNAEVSAKNAKASEDKAKMYSENAQAVANVSIASKEKAGLVRGGDNLIGEDGELILTMTTTDRTLENSHAGGLRIESVAGESVQESTTGAQLFDKEHVVKGHSISAYDGTLYSDTSSFVTGYIKVNNLSKIVTNMASDSSGNIWGAYYDENQTYIEALGTPNTNMDGVRTFSVKDGAYYVRIACVLTLLDTAIVSAGDILPVYEPYTGGQPSPSPSYPQEIESSVVSEITVSGKNLLKNNATTQTINGVTFTINEDGSVTANGTSSSAFQFIIGSAILSSGTYIVNGCPSDGGTETYTIRIGKGEESAYVGIETGSGYTLTLTEETLISVNIGMGAGAKTSNTTFYPMISIDGGDYEPYTETTIHLSTPITLHGIGEAKDRIVKQDGVWGVERNVGEVVFDGSSDEGWYINNTDTEEVYRLSAPINGIMQNNDNNIVPIMLSSQFIPTTPGGTYLKTEGISAKLSTLHVYCEAFNTSDITTWKTHLQNAPMKVLYELVTPTFEPLPEADQIALHSLVTYGTVTYLSTDSEIEPLIEVEYGTSKIGGHSLEALNTAKRNEINIKLLNQLTTDLAVTMAGSEE